MKNRTKNSLVAAVLAVGIALTTQSFASAATGDVTNNVVGSVVAPASYSCPFGGSIDAAMRQDFTMLTNTKTLPSPKVSNAKFVGIPQSLTCGTWLYGFSFESLGSPVTNDVICQGKNFQGSLTSTAWQKIQGKKLCKEIDVTGTIKLIRRLWISAGFTWKGFSIGVKSGDQTQQTKYFTLQTYVNPYGAIYTHSAIN
jgi:hypothetical protein